MFSGRVVYTSQTISGLAVAVTQGVVINIAVTITLPAGSDWPIPAIGISIESIRTLLTSGTISSLWALCTDGTVGIPFNLKTGTNT